MSGCLDYPPPMSRYVGFSQQAISLSQFYASNERILGGFSRLKEAVNGGRNSFGPVRLAVIVPQKMSIKTVNAVQLLSIVQLNLLIRFSNSATRCPLKSRYASSPKEPATLSMAWHLA